MTQQYFACILPTTGSKKNQRVPRADGRGIMPSADGKKAKAAITAAITAAKLSPDPKRPGHYRMRCAFPMTPPYRILLRLPRDHPVDNGNAEGWASDCLKYAGVIVDDKLVTDNRQVREDRSDIRLEVWGAVTDWRTNPEMTA